MNISFLAAAWFSYFWFIDGRRGRKGDGEDGLDGGDGEDGGSGRDVKAIRYRLPTELATFGEFHGVGCWVLGVGCWVLGVRLSILPK